MIVALEDFMTESKIGAGYPYESQNIRDIEKDFYDLSKLDHCLHEWLDPSEIDESSSLKLSFLDRRDDSSQAIQAADFKTMEFLRVDLGFERLNETLELVIQGPGGQSHIESDLM